jgi:hypothetical protein
MYIAMNEAKVTRQLPPVDDDVFEALQRLAEPLVDDINSVLRRLLDLAAAKPLPPLGASDHPRGLARASAISRAVAAQKSQRRQGSSKASTTKKRGKTSMRAVRGTLLPEREYEMPLLKALDARGGSAPASEVIEAVGAALDGRLSEVDREVLDSGLTRWKNRVQFVRLKLVQAGHVKKDSPRGVWEITPAGRDHVKTVGSNE